MAFVGIGMLFSCSTKQNTAMTRWYHSFTARYNTFYNAKVAYTEGCLAQETGNQDDFTEFLPVFIAGNKKMNKVGSGQYETAITKCEKAIKNHSIKHKPKMDRSKRLTPRQRVFLSLKEYNPFLRNAWLLMGKSQFNQGRFVEAAATFSYACRLYSNQPAVLSEMRAWLARCYTELEWFYDADDVIRKMRRDSMSRQAVKDLDATLADYYIRQQKYEESLPYLKKMLKREHRKKLKARGYFLMAQIYNYLDRKDEAYKMFGKVIRQNPPYLVAFNARIMQTEVLSKGKSKQMISKLKRMARSSKNMEYLDQVYYAIGNIELSRGDTAAAILAYEQGVSKGTRQGIERGVLLLHLGDLYWTKKDFTSARRCYTQALGLMDKERKEYAQLDKRSRVLDELEPYTAAVHLQDSLQHLVNLPETERNKCIDLLIADLKKREKAARRNAADSLVQAARGAGNVNSQQASSTTTTSTTSNSSGDWYFYNQQTVNQGKELFRRQWGSRQLEDNWRRSNKSVLSDEDTETETDEDVSTDSTAVAPAKSDSVKGPEERERRVKPTGDNDPHERAYYLKQLPFTEEARIKSDSIIMFSLYNAGLIEKDKLEDFSLARESFLRIVNQYPSFSKLDDVLYQLFLIEGRFGNLVESDGYRSRLAAEYPESQQTKLITAPNYEYNARYGKQQEDSIYQQAYSAYLSHDTQTMMKNCAISAANYPEGANRPRFMFLNAMGQLRMGERDTFLVKLRELVKTYPEEPISQLAGMIVRGLESGRIPGSDGLDFNSFWTRRSAGAQAFTDSISSKNQLSAERNTPFSIIMVYPTDSVNENDLLYEVAHFNFTKFTVRNFDVNQETQQNVGQLRVGGFQNFDEAISYARSLHKEESLKPFMKSIRMVVISETNLKQLGINYSLEDYQKFYMQKFAPVFVRPELEIDRKTDLIQGVDVLPSDTAKQAETSKKQDEETDSVQDEDEYFDVDADDNAKEENDNVIIEDVPQKDDEEEWYDY